MTKEELLKLKDTSQKAINAAWEAIETQKDIIASLENEVEEIDAKLRKLSGRAEIGGKYYCIGSDDYLGNAFVMEDTEGDYEVIEQHFNSGNYFLTKEEAQKEADYINFRLQANKWQRENDGDFKPDWTDENRKWSASYMVSRDELQASSTYQFRATGEYYFSTEQIAERFAKEFEDELKRGW